MEKVIQEEKEYFVIVMEDFNAKVWMEKGGRRHVGNFEHGKRNHMGIKLVELAQENNIKIANTFSKKKDKRKWT